MSPTISSGKTRSTIGYIRAAPLAYLLVGSAVVLVYANSIGNSFHYDDFHSIVHNPHIRDLGNLGRFFGDATLFSEDPRSSMYRPVLLATYAITQYLHPASDLDPSIFRIINIIIHMANVGIVMCFVSITCRQRWVGIGAGAIFALQPVNSEIVNYISSRSESLCTLFLLSSLTLYAVATRIERWRFSLYLASVVAFAAALGSKSIAITLIAVLPLLEWSTKPSSCASWLRRTMQRNWPYWIVGSGYLIVARNQLENALVKAPVRDVSEQVFTQLKAAVFYSKLLAMPTELNVEHQFSVATTGLSLAASTAIFACLSFVFVAVRLYSLPRKWMFWLAWPVVTSAPVVLVPLHVLVNEHRMYLPMVAFGAFLSALFVRLFSRDRRAAVITATCLLIVYSLLVIERNVVWQNSKSLWTDALRKAPFMPRPHIFVGDVHKEEGRHESALKEYRTAAAVSPQLLSNLDRVVIYNNMGATLLAMGRFNEAIEHYQKALSVDPTYEKALASLEGLLAVSTDARIARAEELHERGLRLLVRGEVAQAIESFKSSLEIQSSPETWFSLGICYERLQRWEEAIDAYHALTISGQHNARYSQTAAKKLHEIRLKLGGSDEVKGR